VDRKEKDKDPDLYIYSDLLGSKLRDPDPDPTCFAFLKKFTLLPPTLKSKKA
jgi:hypothetical protein